MAATAPYDFELPEKKYVGILACQRDSLLKTIETVVANCSKAKNKFEVEFLDTVLFPEGGGQPGDLGFVHIGDEAIPVSSVYRSGLDAKHVVSKEIAEGTPVRLAIDETHRHDKSTQHTGQHLFSAVVDNLFGAKTLSWGMPQYPQPCYAELDKQLTPEQLDEVERACNEAIRNNLKVQVHVRLNTDESERPEKLPRDYIGGVVRVVEIKGLDDHNPCCGTHYPSLGYLQSIAVFPETSKAHGTNYRHYFATGPRVLQLLKEKHSHSKGAAQLLNCQAAEVPDRLAKLQASSSLISRQDKKLKEDLALFVAQSFDDKSLVACFMDATYADMQFATSVIGALSDKGKKLVAFWTPSFVVIQGGLELVSSLGNQIKESSLSSMLKGGGARGRWQGKWLQFSPELSDQFRTLVESMDV